jgi:transaldolase
MESQERTLSLTRPVEATGLAVRIFADGADIAAITAAAENPLIQGFTTNPTLMRKAGVTDYERFAREVLEVIGDRPVSFEVFSDEWSEMERQARKIASWGENIYVKIPVTNTHGEPSDPLLVRLTKGGVRVNVTGLLTVEQVERAARAGAGAPPTIISVFAGRIADTGVDPLPIMCEALTIMADAAPAAELIWASPRELLNVVQADRIGCHIITVTHDLVAKLPLLGKSLATYSLETVQMFHADALAAGFEL